MSFVHVLETATEESTCESSNILSRPSNTCSFSAEHHHFFSLFLPWFLPCTCTCTFVSEYNTKQNWLSAKTNYFSISYNTLVCHPYSRNCPCLVISYIQHQFTLPQLVVSHTTGIFTAREYPSLRQHRMNSPYHVISMFLNLKERNLHTPRHLKFYSHTSVVVHTSGYPSL